MKRLVAVFTAFAILAFSVVAHAAPASAKGGEIGGSGNEYHLSDSFSAQANISFAYGAASDRAYAGDWNRDGIDSLAVRRGNIYHLRNALSGGAADRQVAYGRTTDVVLVGDWNGDGIDTLAVRRGNIYHFKNSLNSGTADRVVAYGRTTDRVLAGDWNGDGIDTLAVRRDNIYYIANSFSGGSADRVVAYGRATDAVLAGDWNADGVDSLGIRRPPVPPVWFGAGTWRVGVDVPSGTYRSNSTSGSCYWERLSGFGGTFDEIISNDFGQNYAIVTISSADAGFDTNEYCGTWTAVNATYPSTPSTSFSDGEFVVGSHIAPGTYQASGLAGKSCYWERLSGFSGESTDIIQNDWADSTVVTIGSSDKGFASSGCGRWTRR